MTNVAQNWQTEENEINDEVFEHIKSKKSLSLSSIDKHGFPFASYAPFSIGEQCLYVLLSEVAIHGENVALNPNVSALIIEDESTAKQLFARVRVNYQMNAQLLSPHSKEWNHGINSLQNRHGKLIGTLSQLEDFKLFKLDPIQGRYVKGFGKAYQINGGQLIGHISHLTKGHQPRVNAQPQTV